MPRQNTVIQIFVASPSDVSEERHLLDQVVAELNVILSRSLNISFELVKWEKDVRPGFSSEPQEVINKQVQDEYDVFVGIFWHRVGTPTNSAISGSLEEFNRAVSRNRKLGAPEIMIYFKEVPVPLAKIDIAQLKNLQEFRNSISSQGGLYSTFEDASGFESLVRMHLAAIAHSLNKNQNGNVSHGNAYLTKSQEGGFEEDLGYLDYIDLYVNNMGGMTECIGLFTRLMQKNTERTSKRTDDMRASHANSDRMRVLFRLQAEDMNSFADEVKPLAARHAIYREAAFDALSKAVSLHHEIGGGNTGLETVRKNISSLLESTATAKKSVEGMRDAALGLPRLVKEVNVAKRNMAGAIDSFVDEMSATISTANNVLGTIERLSR